MKFDVIIGNPPFQSEDKSTSTNLWSDFFVKSAEISNTVAMIMPKTWAAPKQRKDSVLEIISKRATHINIDECSKHFKVASTFSYVILGETSTSAEVCTPEGTFKSDLDKFVKRIPNNINLITLSILDKFYKHEMLQKEKNISIVGNCQTEKDENHPYRVQFAFTTVKWSDTKHYLQNAKKVIFPNQNTKNYPLYDEISQPCNRGAVYLVSSKEEGENIVETCKKKLLSFVISQQRFHHGLINTSVTESIPSLDYTNKWTDQDLYKHFGMTQEEIDYLEANL